MGRYYTIYKLGFGSYSTYSTIWLAKDEQASKHTGKVVAFLHSQGIVHASKLIPPHVDPAEYILYI